MNDSVTAATVSTAQEASAERAVSFAGWGMVGLAVLSMTCATGLTFGIYGTIVGSLQAQLGVNRTMASACISALVLFMGLASPLVGELLQRVSVRAAIIAGALCLAAGYAGLLVATNFYVVLAIYALVLGPAYCLLGPIPASTLVSKWFVRYRGRALGLVNMPLGLFIVPPISAALVRHYGIHGAYIGGLGVSLAVVPIFWLVVSQPSDIGQAALGAAERDDSGGVAGNLQDKPIPALRILRIPVFWLVMAGCCVFTGAGITVATHIVPLAQERGLNLQSASMLLSVFGVCGAAGAPFWGWLADRAGPVRAYIAAAGLQAVLWCGLFYTGGNISILLPLVALIGFSGSGSVVPLAAASLATWLGPASFSRALGLSYFVKLPFLVGAPMLAGWLHDVSGNYQTAILCYVVALPLVAVLFIFFAGSARAAAK